MSEYTSQIYEDLYNAQEEICNEQQLREGIDEMSHIYISNILRYTAKKPISSENEVVKTQEPK